MLLLVQFIAGKDFSILKGEILFLLVCWGKKKLGGGEDGGNGEMEIRWDSKGGKSLRNLPPKEQSQKKGGNSLC